MDITETLPNQEELSGTKILAPVSLFTFSFKNIVRELLSQRACTDKMQALATLKSQSSFRAKEDYVK